MFSNGVTHCNDIVTNLFCSTPHAPLTTLPTHPSRHFLNSAISPVLNSKNTAGALFGWLGLNCVMVLPAFICGTILEVGGEGAVDEVGWSG